MKIKAVVFDLDGLMLNTEEIFNISGRELLLRRNKEMTPELLSQMMGRRPHDAFGVMVTTLELTESIEDLLLESKEIFRGLLDDLLAPMPGLFELLDCIEKSNLLKGVATSSPREYMNEMLNRFDLGHRFQLTLSAEDVTHGKPHPEIYSRAAEQLQIDPAEMLVLEDSEAGTKSASAAGAVTVAVPNKHSRDHDLSDAHFTVEALNDQKVLEMVGC